MQFNIGKCYVMHIMTPHQRKEALAIHPSIHPLYLIQGVELKAVMSITYLGATISNTTQARRRRFMLSTYEFLLPGPGILTTS